MYRNKLSHLTVVVLLLFAALMSTRTIAFSSSQPSPSPANRMVTESSSGSYSPPWAQMVGPSAESPAMTTNIGNGIRINEVLFYPDSGDSEWVELKNEGPTSVSIDGYAITDEDGNWYKIPAALPPVPAGSFVLVIFDGLGSGSNDYDFGDGKAVLHTPAGVRDVFADDADQCALYVDVPTFTDFVYLPIALRDFSSWNPPVPSPPTEFAESPLIGFVAWGAEPGRQAEEASAAELWDQEWYVDLFRGLGEESDTVSIVAGESIGLLPGSETTYPDNWILFQAAEVTKGEENPWPIISWYYPDAGATVDGATFAVSWNAVGDATGYQFQLDDNTDFSSPYADAMLTEPSYIPATPVPEDTYYWRVKVLFDGSESPWSPGVEINSLTLPSPTASASRVNAISFKTLGITWQQQHKDTNMLCLDGDAEAGNQPWNAPHSVRGTHGRNYCVRASVSMIASYYGGKLSQDRITYETFKRSDPEGEMGHDKPFSGSQARSSLSWALGTNVPADFGKPTFAEIKAWIDANQPLRAVVPGHSRAIDGYLEYTSGATTWRFLHILDPWDRDKWVSYEDDNILYVQAAPAGTGGAPDVRSDEDVDGDGTADTMDDSDGDGVCDFDERNRFNTSPTDADSDDDLVPDLADIREYVFDAAGTYSKRNADIDGDGKRKELDPDNDQPRDDGLMDGCEDGDHDGRYEPALGESDNFKPTDDMNLHVQLRWPQLGSDVDLHLIKPGGSYRGSGDCYYYNPSPDWGMPGVDCDDPRLDVDCITQCTVENIRLSKLENGTYRIKVHYYSDHNLGPTSASVTVWVKDVPHTYSVGQLTDGQVWDVATVQWPSMAVTAGAGVTAAEPASEQHRAMRK